MRRLKNGARWMAGYLAFVIWVLVVIRLLRPVIEWFETLESGAAVALVGLVTVIVSPVFAYVTNRALEQRKQLSQASHHERLIVYRLLIQRCLETISDAEGPGHVPDLIPGESFESDLTFFASTDVLQQWHYFRIESSQDELSETDMEEQLVKRFERLLRVVRKDLGHLHWQLEGGEIASLFQTSPHL